jgi:hypothetical protein
MKKVLKQPKVIVYENVEKVNNVLEFWGIDEVGLAEEILQELNMLLGKKTEIELFENNVEAVLEDGKITMRLAK